MKTNNDKIFYATDEQNRLYNELKIKKLNFQVKKEKILYDYNTKIATLQKQQQIF